MATDQGSICGMTRRHCAYSSLAWQRGNAPLITESKRTLPDQTITEHFNVFGLTKRAPTSSTTKATTPHERPLYVQWVLSIPKGQSDHEKIL
jgi:hypothetical protein